MGEEGGGTESGIAGAGVTAMGKRILLTELVTMQPTTFQPRVMGAPAQPTEPVVVERSVSVRVDLIDLIRQLDEGTEIELSRGTSLLVSETLAEIEERVSGADGRA